MSEPTEEAREAALSHWNDITNCCDGEERGDAMRSLVATLQRLMDERDAAEEKYRDLRGWSIEKLRFEESRRADAAEKALRAADITLDQVMRFNAGVGARLEELEKNAAMYREQWDNEKDRAEKAERAQDEARAEERQACIDKLSRRDFHEAADYLAEDGP